jgi:hypothetical protein
LVLYTARALSPFTHASTLPPVCSALLHAHTTDTATVIASQLPPPHAMLCSKWLEDALPCPIPRKRPECVAKRAREGGGGAGGERAAGDGGGEDMVRRGRGARRRCGAEGRLRRWMRKDRVTPEEGKRGGRK